MKGIIIYEDYRGKEVVEAIKLGMVNYECKSDTSDGSWINNLSGVRKESTQAYCNKEDTYDFETGALIALMKMCGFDKSYKAIEEAFKYNSYDTKKTKELERAYKASNDDKAKLVEYYQREIKKLEAENEKLKLDCEKLCHGYNGSDMIFCGGRQNGKQYTLLVDLFKKLDQKKVDAAYKEAYNTTLPVWQREFLKEALSIYKPPTKREQMWNDILACGDCEHSKYVKVKKEDLETFAKECNEKKIFNIIGYDFHTQEFWFADDRCIFQIFRKPAGFICAKSVGFASEDTIIDYLPPMRWDLFKKGRIAVRLTKDNYKDFYDICEKELGRSPSYKPEEFAYVPMEKFVLKYSKKGKGYTFLGSTESEKIVNWEDVR